MRRMNIKHILQLSSGVGGAVTFFTNKEKLAEFRLKPIVSSQRSVLVKIKPFLAFFFFNKHGKENHGRRKHPLAHDLEKSEVAKAISGWRGLSDL